MLKQTVNSRNIMMMQPQTHHQCCFLKSLGISGLTTDTLIQATRPKLNRLQPMAKQHSNALTTLPSSARAIGMYSLQLLRCSPVSTCYAQCTIDLTSRVTGKSLAAHPNWHTSGFPTISLTLLYNLLILIPLYLLCLLSPFLFFQETINSSCRLAVLLPQRPKRCPVSI